MPAVPAATNSVGAPAAAALAVFRLADAGVAASGKKVCARVLRTTRESARKGLVRKQAVPRAMMMAMMKPGRNAQ